MILKYALTRVEVVQFFLISLALSPRLAAVVVIVCLWPSFVSLSVRGALMRSLTAQDLFIASCWALGAFVLLSLWIFVRGKTAERTFEVSSEGISTAIGALSGQIPWCKIKTVKDAGKYVLISRTSGNSFFIPSRAFSGPDEKAQFLSNIGRWRIEG